MSYLRFERSLMTNLEESLSRELLRTNRSGAYACSTIVDCNTRKYHGLLVVPEVISYGEYKSGKRIAGIVNALTGIFFSDL